MRRCIQSCVKFFLLVLLLHPQHTTHTHTAPACAQTFSFSAIFSSPLFSTPHTSSSCPLTETHALTHTHMRKKQSSAKGLLLQSRQAEQTPLDFKERPHAPGGLFAAHHEFLFAKSRETQRSTIQWRDCLVTWCEWCVSPLLLSHDQTLKIIRDCGRVKHTGAQSRAVSCVNAVLTGFLCF